MDIFVVMQGYKYDSGSRPYCAYKSAEKAQEEAKRLNEIEDEREQKYNEWVNSEDEDDASPEWGDRYFFVSMTQLVDD